jgi:hypothetical protein
MKLRGVHTPRLPNPSDSLPLLNLITPPNQQLTIVCVSRDPSAIMFDKQKVPKAPQLISRVRNNTIVCGFHGCARWRHNVDPIVV